MSEQIALWVDCPPPTDSEFTQLIITVGENCWIILLYSVNLWPVHMEFQIPLMLASPNIKTKSQLMLASQILIIICKIFVKLVLRDGSSFLLDPTLNTSLKPHFQKVLSCGCPCHTWVIWFFILLWDSLTEGRQCMPTPSFCQVERRFHNRELNHQPLP